MKFQIIVDGVRVEGEAAERIFAEVTRNVDGDGRPLGRRWRLGYFTGSVVAAAVVAAILGATLPVLARSIPKVWIAIICSVVSVVATVIWGKLYVYLHRRELREAMRRHGFDLCTECGYWLKGLPAESRRCPECGADRPAIEDKPIST